ncbi:MAG: DUF4384 domain-containing protein, partial [Acidobacteriota bacterium]
FTRQSSAPVGPGEPTAPAAVATTPLLSYSMTTRRNPKRYPNDKERELAAEIMFTPGDELRVNITSRQDGHLYIINQGPQPVNGLPSYNVLFPAPSPMPEDAATVRANQTLFLPSERPPWFHVDAIPGTETLWLIWSSEPVAELEKVRKWLTPVAGGKIKDDAEIKAVKAFLDSQQSAAKPIAEKDEAQVNLKARGKGLLIYPLRLQHL